MATLAGHRWLFEARRHPAARPSGLRRGCGFLLLALLTVVFSAGLMAFLITLLLHPRWLPLGLEASVAVAFGGLGLRLLHRLL